MTLYYWDKYNNNRTSSSTTTYTDGGSVQQGNYPQDAPISGYSSWSFNDATGVYNNEGSYITIYPGQTGTVYNGGSSTLQASVCHGDTYDYWTRTAVSHTTTTYYDNKGSFIGTYTDAYDAHTDNALNSDGYWWVRRGLAETPTVVAPNGNESINTTFDIQWSIAAGVTGLQSEIQLSSDNGATWKDLVALTAADVIDYNYDFTNETGASSCLIRIRLYDGASYGPWDQSDGVFTIQHNTAATAPTNLSPSGGTSKDRGKTVRFAWQYNDPDSNDSQSKFDLQWRPKGNTAWATVSQSTPNTYYDMPGNTLPHGDIEWQVRTYDQAGLVGPYSALATFLAGDKPATPTFTSPTNGASVPIANPTVQWSSIGQTGFTLTVKDSAGNQVYTYSGTTNKAVTIQYDLANGAVYTLNLSITNADNLTSDVASESVTVSYTPPEKPVLTVSHDEERGSIVILIIDPTPTGTEPTVTYNEVFRRIDNGDWLRLVTNLKINSTYSDYTPASDQMYEYYVRAWGDNGTFSDSDIISESVSISDAQIALLSDPTQWIGVVLNDKSGGPDRNFKHSVDRTLMQFAGREYPIAEFSEFDSLSIGLSFLVQGKEDMDMLRQLAYSRETLLYRDSRGRREFVTIDSLDESDYPFRDWYSVSVNPMRVSFVEGV